jgi:glycosyltransferase involved in cell wall biosynthesis
MDGANSNTKAGDEVDIVLPCYNAAAWIDGFIAALPEADDVPWRLVVRDDGSTDNSLILLKNWRDRLGARMVLLDAEMPCNLGLIGNYDAVLAASTAPWVLTADPDDVWLPNRLAVTLSALRAAEQNYGAHTPLAICTDAMVVSETLDVIAPSYWRWSRTRPLVRPCLARSAMDSVALGSTMAVNRALIEKSRPLPAGAAYQDWWMVLVAVAFGRFIALPEITIKYRRHSSNATKDPFSTSWSGAMQRYLRKPKSIHDRLDFLIRQAARQADEFVNRYDGQVEQRDVAALRSLARLPQMNQAAKRLAILSHGLWFNSPLKNAGLLAFI